MRQAGIIAAPGIYAMNNMVERLAEDHLHAKMLGEKLKEIPDFIIKPVDTNIVIVDTSKSQLSADDVNAKLTEKGILVTHMGEQLFRLVTYFGITTEHVKTAIEAISEAFLT